MKQSCKKCKYFTSYKEDYCDDLEPDDEGFCSHEISEDGLLGSGTKCKAFKPLTNLKQ